MQQLNEAIATVLREVERTFAVRRAAGGLPLAPERIRISLNFALAADGAAHAQPDGAHSVTVEFKVGEAGPWQPVAGAAVAVAPAATLPAESGIVPALTQVFGAPGFDSSARATVFRETLAERTHVEAEAIAAALTTPLASIADERARQAVHILRGVILSGPAKQVERGAEVFRQIFARHPLAEVMRVAEAEWKTQDAWLD